MSISQEQEFEKKARWQQQISKAIAKRQDRPSFGSAISDIIGQLRPKHKQFSSVNVNLADILGIDAQGHYKIDEVNNFTAKIIVDSSVWMYQIQSRKHEILEKFKRTTGCKKIKNIRLELGQV